MLFLYELKNVLVLVKKFTSVSSIETFLPIRYYSHGSSFPIQLFANGGIQSKNLNSANTTK